MITNRLSAMRPASTGCVAFCLLLMATLAAPAALAGEPGFYSGGKFHPVIVSESEFAVELEAGGIVALGQHLRSMEGVALEPVPWASGASNVAILRLPAGDMSSRLRVRRMAGVRSMHRVYRFDAEGRPVLSSGRIVVCLRAGIDDAQREAMFADYRVRAVEQVAGLSQTFLVEPIGDVADVELDTANALYRDDRTVYAHPDLRLPIDPKQVIQFGTDTFFDKQWPLVNSGDQGGVAGEDISIGGAWLRSTGAGILIGQLDDACDVEHDDLIANYIGISQDITNNKQSTLAANPVDVGDRHGTATMGLIVATSNNATGIAGVSPSAAFTASRGLLAAATTSQLASAFNFARNTGVDVHNNSWGFESGAAIPDVMVSAIQTAFNEGRDGLGMVICFASGNGAGMMEDAPEGQEVESGEDIATLPTVIGVGACTAAGKLATYSNYGVDIDVLAPSNDPNVEGLPAIVTTDNRDGMFTEPGYNNDGVDDDGNANLADDSYTDNFGGTSAAAPIVSGVAAMILALEPQHNATTVRTTIEHTCDKIDAEAAAYNGITSRSLRYGYGRVNAGAAVEATYDGYYWPNRVADVQVAEPVIRWKINDDLREFGSETSGAVTESVLVVRSDNPFSWAPTDSTPYSVGQEVADGVTVVANLLAEQYNYGTSSGTKYFGIYSVTFTPRRGFTYGFGVSVSSEGTIIDSGSTAEVSGSGGEGPLPPGSARPRVTIEVSTLKGTSPLTVTFKGNAQSSIGIPSDGYRWDFGDGSTSNQRNTSHTYTVASGSQRFFPRLSVTDVEGNVGERSVAIDVTAPDTGSGDDTDPSVVSVAITDPNSSATNVSSGEAPLEVILTATVSGSLPSGSVSVFWDLGDGNTATGVSVAHTYTVAGTFPITVTITSAGSGDVLKSSPRFLEVTPSTDPSPSPTATPGGTNGTGDGSSSICGAGTAVAFWGMGLFFTLRRRLR